MLTRAPFLAVALVVACGRDVDLGGAVDAGAVGVTADACPCAADVDGALRDPCGLYVPPASPSTCRACDAGASDCQKNGCYGGYWCESAVKDCHEPLPACR
jgi:hypothetical protein